MDGYTKLGFLGGMAVPAVIRYGYGWLQGARDAAKELGVEVECNYTYGGQFFGDANITAKMEGWYAGGTEIVFACGGGIYTSAAEAAAKVGGKMIGVDSDQSYLAPETVLTSAMKRVDIASQDISLAVLNGEFVGGERDGRRPRGFREAARDDAYPESERSSPSARSPRQARSARESFPFPWRATR